MTVGNMQNYQRVYDYITDWQRLIYDYYQKHAIAFLCTYYNLDISQRQPDGSGGIVWDNQYLDGGFYEMTGDLSGIRWIKYELLPVFWVEETLTDFEAREEGLINVGESALVIPSQYGITPYNHDIIKFSQEFLVNDESQDKYEIFQVSGIKKRPPQDKMYWWLKLETYQSKTTDNIDPQVTEVRVFVEYTKKIHSLAEATTITRMMSKNESLRSRLKGMFDQNSGFYLL